MTPTEIDEALERFYHRARLKLGAGLHKFVLAEEEETRKLQRRFHIHVGVILTSWMVSYLCDLSGVASALVITGTPAWFLLMQEFFDNVGR